MAGHLGIPKLRLDTIGGNCPVQAEGFIAGIPFYFRARGERWSFGIGADPIGDPEWYYTESYGDDDYSAGWMSENEAREFIAKAARMYLGKKAP